MERFDSLRALNNSKFDWKIKARVIRIWDSYNVKEDNKFKGRNLLLLDDKHCRIHAFIWPNNVQHFGDKFVEGKVYIIKNFEVKKYFEGSIRCIRNDKQIWLSRRTDVTVVNKPEKMIRENEFSFFDIGEIKGLSVKNDQYQLLDLIGEVKKLEPLDNFVNRKNKEQYSLRFELSDGSSFAKISFWDEFAVSLDAVLKKAVEKPVILIVASGRLTEFKEELYISNVAATRFFVNYSHHSVIQMRHRSVNKLYLVRINDFSSVLLLKIPAEVLQLFCKIGRLLDQ
ncbi:hypothetical protein POM88_030455 [Heracleum sosnowskyi]|uniref:Replication protein A 70 kDa DNA-binding subunit B/D first OB fold domain-containing protein n=1 Tax=Heracleum sosnowskyi TaxID=360622 RepID=A0AAD8HXF7_9APIA|nr:hypothetical protein POM88_030455 [Heracleum sosnowskyi]